MLPQMGAERASCPPWQLGGARPMDNGVSPRRAEAPAARSRRSRSATIGGISPSEPMVPLRQGGGATASLR